MKYFQLFLVVTLAAFSAFPVLAADKEKLVMLPPNLEMGDDRKLVKKVRDELPEYLKKKLEADGGYEIVPYTGSSDVYHQNWLLKERGVSRLDLIDREISKHAPLGIYYVVNDGGGYVTVRVSVKRCKLGGEPDCWGSLASPKEITITSKNTAEKYEEIFNEFLPRLKGLTMERPAPRRLSLP